MSPWIDPKSTKAWHQKPKLLGLPNSLRLEKLFVTIKRECTSNRRAKPQMIPCSCMLLCNMCVSLISSLSVILDDPLILKSCTLWAVCLMYTDRLHQDFCSQVVVPSICASSCRDNMCPNSKRVFLIFIELSKGVVHMTMAGFISTHGQKQVPHGSFVS